MLREIHGHAFRYKIVSNDVQTIVKLIFKQNIGGTCTYYVHYTYLLRVQLKVVNLQLRRHFFR